MAGGAPVSSESRKRERLVALGQAALKSAALPRGYNAVIVVTDSKGEWCAVSSSDDAYTHGLLTAALHGAEVRLHAASGKLLTRPPSDS